MNAQIFSAPAIFHARALPLVVASVAAAGVVLALSCGLYVLHGQLVDTQATLASTQDTLSSSQSQLRSTQDQLNSTQASLSDTQQQRDAFSAQVDTLNANVADLTKQRDDIQSLFKGAQTDLEKARTDGATTAQQRDQATNALAILGQAVVLENNLLADVGAYMQTSDTQLQDLNSAVSAAVRYDWVGERVYVAQYNSRLALMNSQAANVKTDVQRLQDYVHSHGY